MKFLEYLELIKRTRPNLDVSYYAQADGYGEASLQDVSVSITLPRNLLNQIHTRLGIVGEFDELITALRTGDLVNILEELCDILWYVGNDINIKLLRNQISGETYRDLSLIEFGKIIQVTDGGWLVSTEGVIGWFHSIVFNSSRLINLNKRDLAYKKEEPREEYIDTVKYLLGAINNMAYDLHLNLEEGMQKNIDKLIVRYPDKFSDEKALNRDLEKEREVLEKEPPHDAEERQVEYEQQFIAKQPLTPNDLLTKDALDSLPPEQPVQE